MMECNWDESIKSVSKILMQPIVFNDLKITFIDIIGARHESDWTAESHRHPWYEFNYVSQGAVYTKIKDAEFLVTAGNIYLIPPGVAHSHRHFNHTGDDGFCVRWELERVVIPESSNTICVSNTVIDAFSHIQPDSYPFAAESLFDNAENLSLLEMQTVFLKWLLDMCRVISPDSFADLEHRNAYSGNKIVKQVIMYLEEYHALDIDVNELADSVGYSYGHLARLFKEETGSTIIEKLNGIRISKAISLLEDTDMPIGAICSEVGFNSVTYFSKLFNEYTHMPPSAFKNRNKK